MPAEKNKIVIVDIDGVLVDYPNCFLEWVTSNTGKQYDSLQCMKDSMTRDEYEAVKEAYRCSGVKRVLKLNSFCRELLETCRLMGLSIWVVTTRPNREPIVGDTMFWLDANTPYDFVFFVMDKTEFVRSMKMNNLVMVLDDELGRLL
jgi:hypothetical protein